MLMLLNQTMLSGTDENELDDLIKGIAAHDTHALEALYNKTKASVYGFALSVLRLTGVEPVTVSLDTFSCLACLKFL